MGKHSATEEPVLTGTADATEVLDDDQAEPEALWSVRYAVTGARETVTTSQLQDVLRGDRPVFEVNAIPLTAAAAA